jgi:hypothetical protein
MALNYHTLLDHPGILNSLTIFNRSWGRAKKKFFVPLSWNLIRERRAHETVQKRKDIRIIEEKKTHKFGDLYSAYPSPSGRL